MSQRFTINFEDLQKFQKAKKEFIQTALEAAKKMNYRTITFEEAEEAFENIAIDAGRSLEMDINEFLEEFL